MPDRDFEMGDSRHQTHLDNLIRLKAAYNGAIMVSHLRADITINDLNTEIKDMCCFQVGIRKGRVIQKHPNTSFGGKYYVKGNSH